MGRAAGGSGGYRRDEGGGREGPLGVTDQSDKLASVDDSQHHVHDCRPNLNLGIRMRYGALSQR